MVLQLSLLLLSMLRVSIRSLLFTAVIKLLQGRQTGFSKKTKDRHVTFDTKRTVVKDLTHSIPSCSQCLNTMRQYPSNKTTKQKDAHSKFGSLTKKL